MTLEVCYAEMGADYAEVLERLRDERLIRRYVLRFPDAPSYDALCRAMSGGRLEEAFLAAHTLKGITQSLGFGGLCASTSALTEALRNGARAEADRLLQSVTADYRRTVDSILRFQGEDGVGGTAEDIQAARNSGMANGWEVPDGTRAERIHLTKGRIQSISPPHLRGAAGIFLTLCHPIRGRHYILR